MDEIFDDVVAADEVVAKEVRAIGVATHTGPVRTALGAAIEAAMAAAVLECNAEGISTAPENSAIIRERMMAARERVKVEYQALEAQMQAGETQMQAGGAEN
jgi:hypothetical protein